jgi:activator of HSP90 ATPase
MTERPDCKNVNNWHWVEKNAEPWSREELKKLLIEQSIEKGPLKIEFKEFKKLEGDATGKLFKSSVNMKRFLANNRKAKLIFLYDWIIEIEFVAKIAGSELEYKGVLSIPNLSDENEASEIDVSFYAY